MAQLTHIRFLIREHYNFLLQTFKALTLILRTKYLAIFHTFHHVERPILLIPTTSHIEHSNCCMVQCMVALEREGNVGILSTPTYERIVCLLKPHSQIGLASVAGRVDDENT